jgi:hypothetical protein
MGDDHALPGNLWRHLRQHRSDVLVRQAMKAVTLHASATDLLRQWHHFRHGRLAVVKAGVEAGDLWHAGLALRHGLDRREVVGLMQRRERHQLAQLSEQRGRDDRRVGALAPVHDPVTHAKKTGVGVSRAQPLEHLLERAARVADRCSGAGCGDRSAAGVAD